MRVLILTVTAGFGHHATAKALEDELTARGAMVATVDMLKYASKFLFNTVDKGYLLSTKYIPRQYSSVYKSLESNTRFRKISINMIAKELIAFKLATFFEGFQPDVVICTHVFSAQVMDVLKRGEAISMPVIGVVTDYTLHPFWEEVGNIEFITTASELILPLAVMKGIGVNRVLPFGIPIHPKFKNRTDKHEAKRMLSLDAERNTILVIGGSMGYGDMFKTIKDICDTDADYDYGLQILCVCGNNEKLYEKLCGSFGDNVRVYGFVNNIDLLMDAADCIVTKPGGLTISEALAKTLPMILVNPIPGHEERNADFMLNNGAALMIHDSFSICEAMFYLFAGQKRLPVMRDAIRAIAHPDATERLCDFVMEMI